MKKPVFNFPLKAAGLLLGLAALLAPSSGLVKAQCTNLVSNPSMNPTTGAYDPTNPFGLGHVLPWITVLDNANLEPLPYSGSTSTRVVGSVGGSGLTTEAFGQQITALTSGNDYIISIAARQYNLPTGPGAVRVILTRRSTLPASSALLWSSVTSSPHQVIHNQSPTTSWMKASSCFTATSNWDCIVICSFAGNSTPQSVVVDDVELFAINKPNAGPDQCTNGSPVTIGTSVCTPVAFSLPVNYSWTIAGSPAVIGSSAQLTVNPAVKTTYVLKKTIGNCSYTDTVVVKGHRDFTDSLIFCRNYPATITADAIDPVVNSFIWDVDPSILATTGNTAAVSMSSPALLRVNEYDPAGCLVSTSEITVFVASNPDPVTRDTTICDGDTLQLLTDSADVSSYSWSNGASGATTSVSAAGTYWVTKTYPGGCTVTDTFHLKTVDCCEGDAPGSTFYRRLDDNFSYPYEFKHSALTSDGGVIFCATRNNAGNNDIYLCKLDADGRRQWGVTYPYTGEEMVTSVIQTHDGKYVVGGTSNSFGIGSNREIFLMKTDAYGGQLWIKTYPKAIASSWARVAVTELSNHNLVLASNADHAAVNNVFLFHETDPDGVSLYTNYFVSSRAFVTVEDITATSDGGLIAIGSSGHLYDYFGTNVIKMDNTLNITWSNISIVPTGSGSYSLSSGNPADRTYSFGRSVIETNHASKKYLITGFHSNATNTGGGFNSYNAMAYRLSGTGTFQDGKEYAINNLYSVFFDADKLSGDDFIVGGGSQMFSNQRNVIGRIDSSLNIDTNMFHYFGSGTTNSVHNIFTTPLGNLNLTGYTSDISGTPQPYYSKLDASGNHFCTENEVLVNTINYPTMRQESFSTTITENNNTLINEIPQALSEDYLCIDLLDICYNFCDGIRLEEMLNNYPYVGVSPVFPVRPGVTYDYSFNFGDGTPWTPVFTGSQIITHEYNAPGTYTVCMRVNVYLDGILVNTCEVCRDVYMNLSPLSDAATGKDIQESAVIYPNPTAAAAVLEFSLTAPNTMDIVVYDVTGKKVAVLATGSRFEAGTNRISFNVAQLSAGTYICKLTGDKSNQVIRFVKK